MAQVIKKIIEGGKMSWVLEDILDEAPSDGKQYVRKNGQWVEVVTGGSFAGTMDDITDGISYVKTENNYTDAEKTKLDELSGGLTSAQILAIRNIL